MLTLRRCWLGGGYEALGVVELPWWPYLRTEAAIPEAVLGCRKIVGFKTNLAKYKDGRVRALHLSIDQ
jgi:hypothetical protein